MRGSHKVIIETERMKYEFTIRRNITVILGDSATGKTTSQRKVITSMLHIYFGELEKVNYGPDWFIANYDPLWLKDHLVQEMIRSVDSSEYVDGLVINSPILGPIPPEKLSGGVKTLIMIYEKPELIFDATSCGPNCSGWLLEIGRKKDVTINLNYLMRFDPAMDLEIYIENESRVVKNIEDYIMTAVKYV